MVLGHMFAKCPDHAKISQRGKAADSQKYSPRSIPSCPDLVEDEWGQYEGNGGNEKRTDPASHHIPDDLRAKRILFSQNQFTQVLPCQKLLTETGCNRF